MKPYPIFLIGLENRHCIVIGGGHEAENKVRGLLDCDATVTVIHPTLTPALEAWAGEGQFTWLQRPYQPGDLHGAFLVIAERADADTNGRIWTEAEAEGALVNVMDDVDHCNFVAGSVVRQGHLTISISTSGAAPALAVRLRQKMAQEFGPEYATFLAWMQQLRAPMSQQYPGFGERRERWYELVDSDILELIRNGRFDLARQRLLEISGIELLESGPLGETQKQVEELA
ncbi:MAG: bifunctional precorrin-2 dehydrogenase/sirohydrochlorin ferrochelatase [Anaerolineaceae bacterium]|nr:bifunctional precorrin-2 dehydrogenase/sirohydrochlorin ferrochelatase [Anaerolineaceae bacterium]